MSSNLWNQELDRKTRWQEEADLNGVGVAFSGSLPVPQDAAYSATWNGDTVFPPTRNAVYDKIETLAPIANPVFTGDPQAPTPATADNDTSIATTAYVKNNLAAYAPLSSPALSGTPTAPTASSGTNNTQLATTAFVKANVTASANTVVLGGTLRLSWGTDIVATNAGGDFTFNFDTAFSSAPATVMFTNGDLNTGNNLVGGVTGSATTGFTGRIWNANTNAAYNGLWRMNWFAVGAA